MRQQTLADASFERYRKPTRRERFLAEMEQVIPWRELCGAIEPFYPKTEGAGRPSGWNGCCASIFCNTGSTCRTRQWKNRCMARAPCVRL